MDEIYVGNYVMLKSGGPVMHVMEIGLYKDEDGDYDVKCTWGSDDTIFLYNEHVFTRYCLDRLL